MRADLFRLSAGIIFCLVATKSVSQINELQFPARCEIVSICNHATCIPSSVRASVLIDGADGDFSYFDSPDTEGTELQYFESVAAAETYLKNNISARLVNILVPADEQNGINMRVFSVILRANLTVVMRGDYTELSCSNVTMQSEGNK